MNLQRIYGVLLQELYITLHSLEVVIDVFLFPLINIVIFGMISIYLAGADEENAAQYVLMGMLLWQIVWIIAYSVANGSLWNIWSRNLSNMFVAPLRVSEYIFAHTLSGVVKALFLVFFGGLLSIWIFHFNIFSIGFVSLALVFIVFGVFAFSMALAVLGFIFRFGTRVQALAWSFITIFQPLTAAFFPLDVMPHALQLVAQSLPPTYAYEAARYALANHGVAWETFGTGLALDAVYCVLCIILFRYLYDASRDTGQFARNES